MPGEPLAAAVTLLGTAAMYEGAEREDVVETVEQGLEELPESPDDVPDEFPDRADAVAPHMTDAIDKMRYYQRMEENDD